MAYTNITKRKLVQPVTYEEGYTHLRLDFGDDDGLVNRLIRTATNLAENYIEKDIAKTECTLTVEDFYSDTIRIDEGNFLSAISVYADGEEVLDSYVVRVYHNYFTVTFTTPIMANDLVVKFYTGFDEDEAPEDIKAAILIKLAELYDIDRSGYVMNNYKATGAFETILNYHKPIRFR